MQLTFEENQPSEIERFAQICHALLFAGVQFKTRRSHGLIEITLTGGI